MKRKLLFFFAVCVFSFVNAQQYFDQLPQFYSYLSKSRQSYASYAQEKKELLRLSDSKDPVQIVAEYQNKLSEVVNAYQDIYQSKAASFAAGVNVVQSSLSAPYQELGGAIGGALTDIYANSARRSAEEQAERDRKVLTIEFEDKFFSIREDLLTEKRKLLEMYLMAASYELSETEEKKYLDLANYMDCECEYIKSNFSLGSTNWVTSNCPRPATSRYAVIEEMPEPTPDQLIKTIERKLRVPSIHFLRAARDFAELGLAQSPKDKRLLFYRAYLSENEQERVLFCDELLKIDPKNADAQALKQYTTMFINVKTMEEAVLLLDYAAKIPIKIPGNPFLLISQEMFRESGYMFPAYRNGKMIYVFPNGSKAFDGEFDFASIFRDAYAYVIKDGKWGVIDRNGSTVIPCLYAKLEGDELGFQAINKWGCIAVKRITGKWGIISIKGDWVVPAEDKECPVMLDKDRFYRIGEKWKWNLYDQNGNSLTKKGLNWVRSELGTYQEGLLKVPVLINQITKWTFVDRNGAPAFGQLFFDEVKENGFENGVCMVVLNGEEFLIDKSGKRVN